MAGVSLNLGYMGKPPTALVKKPLKSVPTVSSTLSFRDPVSISSTDPLLKYSSNMGLKINMSTSSHVSVPTSTSHQAADTPYIPTALVKKPLKSAPTVSSTLSFRDRVSISSTDPLLKYSSNMGLKNMSSSHVSVPTSTSHQADTPYIPIYVMLPLGIITWNGFIGMDEKTELVDGVTLKHQLHELKKCGVDGVMIDCWWGLVERSAETYHWEGYSQLFEMVKTEGLKLQVVMSFHSCGGNVGDDVNISLPNWVLEIGKDNLNIFFTDEQGRENTECLTWGIDDLRVLHDRSAVEVYSDFMYSFREEFSTFFEDGTISEIEVGLGPCGELRYPSYPEIHGWRYPGIGQFQCYDAYLKASLESAAESIGKSDWKKAPEDMGTYNSTSQETGFFCEEGGKYDNYHGRFFLSWYAGVLVTHGESVLSAAKRVFKCTPIAAKVAGVHWCYQSTSHAAELTAGFYNSHNRDGYKAIIALLKKYDVALNFTCVELRTIDQQFSCPHAMADPERLVWQVLNDGWDHGIKVAAENALPCYTREGYDKILAIARPDDSPDGRHLCALTYLRLSPTLLEKHHFAEFTLFVNRLHGK